MDERQRQPESMMKKLSAQEEGRAYFFCQNFRFNLQNTKF
jgi:elongation factor P--beta-lysine ligase